MAGKNIVNIQVLNAFVRTLQNLPHVQAHPNASHWLGSTFRRWLINESPFAVPCTVHFGKIPKLLSMYNCESDYIEIIKDSKFSEKIKKEKSKFKNQGYLNARKLESNVEHLSCTLPKYLKNTKNTYFFKIPSLRYILDCDIAESEYILDMRVPTEFLHVIDWLVTLSTRKPIHLTVKQVLENVAKSDGDSRLLGDFRQVVDLSYDPFRITRNDVILPLHTGRGFGFLSPPVISAQRFPRDPFWISSISLEIPETKESLLEKLKETNQRIDHCSHTSMSTMKSFLAIDYSHRASIIKRREPMHKYAPLAEGFTEHICFLGPLKGYRLVELNTETAYKAEGYHMAHCVASYYSRKNTKIYSLRNSDNLPVATIDVVSYEKGTVLNSIMGFHNASRPELLSDYIFATLGADLNYSATSHDRYTDIFTRFQSPERWMSLTDLMSFTAEEYRAAALDLNSTRLTDS